MDTLARSAVLFLAMLFLSFLAIRTFSRREIQFAGAPAVPSMLTSQLGFRAGMAMYCLLLIFFYLVATYYWGPLKQALGPLAKDVAWLKPVAPWFGPEAEVRDEIVPWIVAVVVTLLFTWDNKYNPFVVVLEGVLDSLEVPDRAVSVFQALKRTKFGRLDETTAKAIVADPEIQSCNTKFFQRDRRDIEYRWAHVCHLRYVLLSHLRQPRYQKFFARNASQWDALDKAYADSAQAFGLWIAGTKDYRDAIDIMESIAKLKDAHYRLLACLAVMTSRNTGEIWERVSEISQADIQPAPGNLARYVVLFPVVLFFAILIGREGSIQVHRLVFGAASTLVPFDVAKLRFWVLVSLVLYSLPIVAVLSFRVANAHSFPFGARRHWGLYGAAFAFGYACAALLLPVMTGRSAFLPFDTQFWRIIYDHEMIWPLMPGLVAAMIAFRLDSRSSCKDTIAVILKGRVTTALSCAAAAVLIATLGSTDSTTLSSAEGFVVVVTTALVAGAAGWLARFETS